MMSSTDVDDTFTDEDFYAKLKGRNNRNKSGGDHHQTATDEVDLDQIQNFADDAAYDDIFKSSALKEASSSSASSSSSSHHNELPLEGQKRMLLVLPNIESKITWARAKKCIVVGIIMVMLVITVVASTRNRNETNDDILNNKTKMNTLGEEDVQMDSFYPHNDEKESTNPEVDSKIWKKEAYDYYLNTNSQDEKANTNEDRPENTEVTVVTNSNTETALEERFVDINLIEPLNSGMNNLPFFWHIPRTGGTSIQDSLNRCNNLIEANEIGITDGHQYDKELEIMKKPSGRMYVNVDMSTEQGVQRAIDLNFVQSGLADVVISARINIASRVFDPPNHRGICFTMMRHPVKRAISLFYHLKEASWEDTFHKEWQNMTLDEYARGKKMETNWMTRALNQKLHGGKLEYDDFQRAKEFLRRKCIIGLTEDFTNSLKRFKHVFHWDEASNGESKCADEMVIQENGATPSKSITYDEKSETWHLLAQHNEFDIELYNYAVELYKQQSYLLK